MLGPGRPEEVIKAVENAQKVLTRQKGYFMTINQFAREARAIRDSNLDPKTKLRKLRERFKKLRRAESREQFRASAACVRRKFEKLLKEEPDPELRRQIEQFIRVLRVYEGQTLIETVKETKQLNAGDTTGAETALQVIERDSAAIVAGEEQLNTILGNVKEKAAIAQRRKDDFKNRGKGAGERVVYARKPAYGVVKRGTERHVGRKGMGKGYNRAAEKEEARRQIQEGLDEYQQRR